MVSLEEISKSLKKKGKFWIAFVGDSITSCEWVHPNWRGIVQYVLQAEMTSFLGGDWKTSEWGIKGFNLAYDGATSRDILSKTDDILKIEPDLVIAMVGANDPFLGVSIGDHRKSVLELKKIFEENGIKFIFSTGNNPWNDVASNKYKEYIEIDKDLGLRGGQLVNLFEASRDFPSERIYTFKSEAIPEMDINEGDLDYWHPNQLGNAYIAKVILREVFGIGFDPELYWKDTLAGEKYPKY